MSIEANDIKTYIIAEDGTLQVKNFTPRTFGEALSGVVKKNWKDSPKRLAKSLKKSPDMLTLTLGLMNCFEDYLWRERQTVEEDIAERTNALEKAAKPDEKVDAANDERLLALYTTLRVYDERLWDIEELSPAKWLKSLSALEFIPVADGVEQFFAQPVNDAWCAFNPALDTAHGRAVHDFRLMSTDLLDALQIEFLEVEGASLPFIAATTLTAAKANKVAKDAGLDIRFVAVRKRAKSTPKSKATEDTVITVEPDEVPDKGSNQKTAAPKKTAAKKTQAKTQSSTEKPAVTIRKTEAKLATAPADGTTKAS